MGLADPRPVAGILLQQQLSRRVFPVHRLDEVVSGLLLFALTPEAQRRASLWFERHQVVKTYEARTHAAVPPPIASLALESTWNTWNCLLAKGKKRAFEAPYGKPSETRYKLISRPQGAASIWHLQPVTGRSHQLRFEMAKHEMPIDGDELYGSKFPSRTGAGIDLRSFHLNFSACSDRAALSLPEGLEISPTS